MYFLTKKRMAPLITETSKDDRYKPRHGVDFIFILKEHTRCTLRTDSTRGRFTHLVGNRFVFLCFQKYYTLPIIAAFPNTTNTILGEEEDWEVEDGEEEG